MDYQKTYCRRGWHSYPQYAYVWDEIDRTTYIKCIWCGEIRDFRDVPKAERHELFIKENVIPFGNRVSHKGEREAHINASKNKD